MEPRIARVSLIAALAWALTLAACSRGPGVIPTSVPVTTPATPLDLSGDNYSQELEAVRHVIREYWEGFNSYDPGRVLALLTEEYLQVRAERITSDIGRLRRWRVKLGWEEEASPTILPQGTAQVFIRIREPLGTRRVEMDFVRRGGAWLITYVEQVE